MEKTEQNITFSYDLVLPQKSSSNQEVISWEVMEKGSEKSEGTRKYKMSFTTTILAMIRLQDYIKVSPCYQSSLFRDQGFDIYLKRELHQPLESVKARGVMYTLLRLSEEQKRKGVIAISSGSFAYILCHYGNLFDIPVTVVMPTTIVDYHIKMCQDTGPRAKVIIHGNDMLEAHSFALRLAQQKGLFYIDGNDHPNMIIGQATLGLEIIHEIENVDVVILPTVIDNCGLTAGIAMAIKQVNPKISIFEVKLTDRDSLVQKIRSQTMSEHELTIPVVKYQWLQFAKKKQIFFDQRIKTNKYTAAEILVKTESFFDYYTTIGLVPIADGMLNMLKGKRVVIPVFGAMDSTTNPLTHRSDPSVPRAGPSTSRE